MKSILIRLIPVVLMGAVVSSAFAHGEAQCKSYPKTEWRPHTELQQKLQSEGWQIRRMELTPTCYEVYAKDVQGKRVEAFFDPKTFERVED